MIIGVRCSVDLMDIAGSLSAYKDIPVEVALPYQCNDFLTKVDRMPELQEYLLAHHVRVTSIHATQGNLTDDNFMAWALPAMRLAQAVGARVVVYHPENVRKDRRMDLQLLALQNVRRLQRESGNVAVGLETFGGPKVILSPEELRDRKLPMVLDTSHLFASRTFEVIESYSTGILVVHLSEPPTLPEHTPHMPVGPVCREVLGRLRQKQWQGVVTLEYMHEYHEQAFQDRERLEKEYGMKPTAK